MDKFFIHKRFFGLIELILLALIIVNIIACGSSDDEKKQPPITSTKVTIQGYVVDLPVKSANVFIYNSSNGELVATSMTDDEGFYKISVEPLDSYVIKAKDGLMDDGSFLGEMFSICQKDSIDNCHVTPMTTLSEKVSHLFQGNNTIDQYSKSIDHLSKTLNIDLNTDPFIRNMNGIIVEDVDLSEIQNQLGQGDGLEDWAESIRSDIIDGYADEILTTNCFTKARQRVEEEKNFEVQTDSFDLETLELSEGGSTIDYNVVSLSTSESISALTSINIGSKNYLSDVILMENICLKDTNSQSGMKLLTEQNIVFLSFNLGPWKNKLNIETTLLTNIFILEFQLLYLPPEEQLRIANLIVQQPEFEQAVQSMANEFNNQETDSFIDKDQLISFLANYAKSLMSENQNRNVSQIVQKRINNASNAFQTHREKRKKDQVKNNEELYTLFSGMQMDQSSSIEDPININFYSSLCLWYAIQGKNDFNNGDVWKSIFMPALITPKSNWIDIKSFTDPVNRVNNTIRTTMPVANVDNSLSSNTTQPAKLIVFRNNPNSWVDAPQMMNTAAVVSVIVDGLAGSGLGKNVSNVIKKGMTKLNNATKLVEKANDKIERIKMAWPTIQIFLEACKQIYFLHCAVTSDTPTDCNQVKGQLEVYIETITSITRNTLSSLEDKNDTEEKLTELKKIAKSIIHDLKYKKFSLIAKKSSSKIIKESGETILILLVNAAFVEPVVIKSLPPAALTYYNKKTQKKEELSGLDYTKVLLKIISKREDEIKTEKEKTIRDLTKTFVLYSNGTYLRQIADAKMMEILQLTKMISSILDYWEKVINLNESLLSINQEKAGKITKLLFKELYKAGVASVKDNAAEIIGKAILNLTPAKVVSIISSVGKGSGMAWDTVTKPNVVPIDISRKDNIINFSIPIPEDILSVRYLKIENEHIDKIVDVFEQNKKKFYKNDNYHFYCNSSSPDDNHWLVMTGFEASVENHAVYKPEDSETIEELCNKNTFIANWHSYRYKNDSGILEILPKKNILNAFLGEKNYFEKYVDETSYYERDHDNPVLEDFMDSHQAYVYDDWNIGYDDLYFLDFTEIYGKGLLKHITPGIYSNFTSFSLNKIDSKEYHNTFNMYVLPNYAYKNESFNISLNEAIQKQSSFQYAENYMVLTLKLYYPDNVYYWGNESMPDNHKGLQYYPFYVFIKYFDKNTSKTHWIGPKEISLSNSRTYSVYLPAIDYERAVVIVYDSILNNYIKKTGKSTISLLSKLLNSNHDQLPFMYFLLQNIERITNDITEKTDSDGDGVIDDIDLWPNNKLYAFDSDQDQMADSWEIQYDLDHLVKNDEIDDDQDGYTNLQEFEKTLELQNINDTLSGYNPKIAAPKFTSIETISDDIAVGYTRTFELHKDLNISWSENINDLTIYCDEPMVHLSFKQQDNYLSVYSSVDATVGESETLSIYVRTSGGEKSKDSLAITLKFRQRLQPPSNLKSITNDGTIHLSWDYDIGADFYRIYISETPLVNIDNYSSFYTTAANAIKINAPNDIVQYIVITASDDIQESEMSNVISATASIPSFQANFNYSINNKTIHFVDQSTGDIDSIVNWIWEFGDGENREYDTFEPSISHEYDLSKAYDVTLKIYNESGTVQQVSKTVTTEFVSTSNIKLTEIGNLETIDNANRILIDGTYAYLAVENNGIRIVDIADPEKPRSVGSIQTDGEVNSLYILNSNLYVGVENDEKGIQVYNIENPLPPLNVSNINVDGSVYGICIENFEKNGSKITLAYLAVNSTENGLIIVDLTDPTLPAVKGKCNTDGRTYSLYKYNHQVFITDYGKGFTSQGAGLKIMNVENYSSPFLVRTIETGDYTFHVNGNKERKELYVSCGTNGFKIIDISSNDTSEYHVEFSISDGTYFQRSEIASQHAFVASRDKGISVVKSVKDSDTIVASIEGIHKTNNAQDVAIYGLYLYVADYDKGLKIIQLESIESNQDLRFIKIDKNGLQVADSAEEWQYIYDTKTELAWEIKSNRDKIETYDNFNTDSYNDYDNKYSADDLEFIIKRLRALSYLNTNNWGLPTVQNIQELISDPEYDSKYFPNYEGVHYTGTENSEIAKPHCGLLKKIWLENGTVNEGIANYKYHAIFISKDLPFIPLEEHQESVSFFVSTNDGCIKLNPEAKSELFKNDNINNIEVFDRKLYMSFDNIIRVFSISGDEIDSIVVSENLYFYNFAILSERRIALFNNVQDEVYIIDETGALINNSKLLPTPDTTRQNLDGVVVGDNFIIIEGGNNNILSLNLGTYEISTFKDLSNYSGWFGTINYYDGLYYISQSKKIYIFSKASDNLDLLVELPEYNITGIALLENYAYVTVNHADKIYKVDITNGDYSIFLEKINNPTDIEFFKED